MNTHHNVKRILVYGDSLVYGKKPGVNERWSANIRFSGILQNKLGDEYEVIEEGLRGRNLKGENSFFPEREGLKQFGPRVGSHLGVDLVVIALGSNDCNSTGDISEESVASALNTYASKTLEWSAFLGVAAPKLLIVIPPVISSEDFDVTMNTVFGPRAPEKQVQLQTVIKSYCDDHSVDYLVASEICNPAKNGDGVHLNEEGNEKLGKGLAKKIITMV